MRHTSLCDRTWVYHAMPKTSSTHSSHLSKTSVFRAGVDKATPVRSSFSCPPSCSREPNWIYETSLDRPDKTNYTSVSGTNSRWPGFKVRAPISYSRLAPAQANRDACIRITQTGGDYRHDKQVKISSTDRGYIFGTQKLPDGRIVVVEADNLRQMVLSWPHHNMRAGGDWALIWVLSIKYICVYCYRPCGGVSTLEHGNSGVDAVLYHSGSCILRLNPTRCIPYIPLDGSPRAILPI